MPRTRSTGQTTKTASRSATAAAEAAIVTSAPRPARGATPAVATGGAAPTRRSSSSAGGEAAVDGELGAGHVPRVVAGQEQRHAGDLARRRDAAERNARLELFAERIREVRRLERRVDDARVDDVAAHTVASELDGQRLRQRDQPALGRRVGVLGAGETDERRHRTHDDDRAAARAPQVRDSMLGHPEHGLEIDRHDAIPPPLVGLEDRAVPVLPEHAGVVVEHVQAAEPARSEEHTSELQSRLHLVCRLLLEKKKPTATVRYVSTSIAHILTRT